MEGKVKIIFSDINVEDAQRYLSDFLDKLKEDNKIKDYEFEIKTDDGSTITHKCILQQGKVIA